MQVKAFRMQTIGRMRDVIFFHIGACFMLDVVMGFTRWKMTMLFGLTANMFIMSERVWAVQKHGLNAWSVGVQHVFVLSRGVVLCMYGVMVLIWAMLLSPAW